jgi:CspA family cold shock protein
MNLGTVKTFDDGKGYGFIAQENGPDCFVHFSEINCTGYRTLMEGNKVEFDPVNTPTGWRATDVWKVTK